jgi:hypothetical protein
MRGGAARRPVPSWRPAAPGGAVGGRPGSRAAAPDGGSAGSTFTTNVALLSILLWRTCCRKPPWRLTRCAMEDSPWDSHQASRRHLLSCTAVDSVAGSWSELTADVLPSFQCGRAGKRVSVQRGSPCLKCPFARSPRAAETPPRVRRRRCRQERQGLCRWGAGRAAHALPQLPPVVADPVRYLQARRSRRQAAVAARADAQESSPAARPSPVSRAAPPGPPGRRASCRNSLACQVKRLSLFPQELPPEGQHPLGDTEPTTPLDQRIPPPNYANPPGAPRKKYKKAAEVRLLVPAHALTCAHVRALPSRRPQSSAGRPAARRDLTDHHPCPSPRSFRHTARSGGSSSPTAAGRRTGNRPNPRARPEAPRCPAAPSSEGVPQVASRVD